MKTPELEILHALLIVYNFVVTATFHPLLYSSCVTEESCEFNHAQNYVHIILGSVKVES